MAMREHWAQAQAKKEGFLGDAMPQCPDLLVQENGKFYLYNRKLAKVPGVNPVVFDSLNGYVQFMKWQRSQGIDCKVMFLQKGENAQGEPDYSGWRREDWHANPLIDAVDKRKERIQNRRAMRKLSQQARALDVSPAYDPQDQLIGLTTPLDKKFSKKAGVISANPMDTGWGGHEYTIRHTPELRNPEARTKRILSRTTIG